MRRSRTPVVPLSVTNIVQAFQARPAPSQKPARKAQRPPSQPLKCRDQYLTLSAATRPIFINWSRTCLLRRAYAMKLAKLAEASMRLQSYLNPKSIEFKLPDLAARAWVGAENGSLSGGPSDTERIDMSQIQAKQDPAILSRGNSRIVTFSRRRSRTPPRSASDRY
jgi:hypothetical protein